MAPNANGLLKRLGVDIEKVGANEMRRLSQYHAESGKQLFELNLEKPNQIWQHKWLLVHRAHLHNALKEAALNKEGKGRPATLRLACKVAAVDPEKAEVTLENGEKISGDVLLGADGVHVSIRHSRALPQFADDLVVTVPKSSCTFGCAEIHTLRLRPQCIPIPSTQGGCDGRSSVSRVC